MPIADKDYVSCTIKIQNNGEIVFSGDEQEIVYRLFTAKLDEAKEIGRLLCMNNIIRNIEKLGK